MPFWDEFTSGYEGPLYAPNVWDQVKLDIPFITIPGTCEVSAKPSKKCDKKKSAGTHGATKTTTGYDPAKVEIRVHIWTPEQYEAWQELLRRIWPRVGKVIDPDILKARGDAVAKLPAAAQKAIKQAAQKETPVLPIYHPALSDLGITAIQVMGIGTPQRGGCSGEKIFLIEGEEFYPSKTGKKAVSTPLAAEPTTTGYKLDIPGVATAPFFTPNFALGDGVVAPPSGTAGSGVLFVPNNTPVAPNLDQRVLGP